MASEDEKYKQKTKAKVDDLKYYFGEQASEWVDLDLINHDKRMTTRVNNASSYSPYHCPKCNKYWSFGLHTTTRAKCVVYIQWERIPCIKKICNNC